MQEVISKNYQSKVSIKDIDLELIDSMDVYKSALGNMSVTMSSNGLDLECYIIAKNGEILRKDFILWEDSYFMPSAQQYIHLFECYPDLDFYQAFEYRLNNQQSL